MKYLLITAMLLGALNLGAQTCSCEKEFLYVKNIVENGFAGFPDYIKKNTEAGYKKKVDQLLKLTHYKFSYDNCPLIIGQYLDLFKSYHLSYWPGFTGWEMDTAFIIQRPLFEVSDRDINRLKKSRSWEGIYNVFDSTMKIAVIKDPTPLHDYVAVVLESTRPLWKKGMVKWEGKLINDSTLRGVSYIRNHRAKADKLFLRDSSKMISWDWLREGFHQTKIDPAAYPVNKPSPVIDARSLSANTFYIKMASFGQAAKRPIDSILKANEQLLNTIPNLILDLRDNGGGGDECWWPFIPYCYTNPYNDVGADLLVSDSTIAFCKKQLENKRLSKSEIDYCTRIIARMESAKGPWVTSDEDKVVTSFTEKAFPKKVIIIADRWCGSSTEEFLLMAKQSKKVTIVGENTVGNLDYSNIMTTPFSCLPYTLVYATTRSHRIDLGQGIDNVGIAPNIYLPANKSWIEEALKIAEQQ
ncbi:hypothetical protein A4D02_14660 [Niastella koreensis]|uniref:Peptidase S41 n=2 Tax=Niastella koreensis TaxID=354356 RepID=G8T882_NIAKG|nr:S41 family peptidase [Niastella koreensis]AEV98033.1 peptidase S41 [Niastella koreensis GR20-10]OQP40169.1 hypothetical protein A4D02_14660 [Niastella koreensis]